LFYVADIPVWHLLPQISLTSLGTLSTMMMELAGCLKNLHRYGDLSAQQFLDLLHEICQYPIPWREENTVLLVMLSGYSVLHMYMHHRTLAV
jgi:hypothetical protein